jgi:uncharacterized damage-inducible protein DinB
MIRDALVPEFDHEMATTRRLLDRAPEAEYDWKPHDRSRSLGELVTHLANIPVWCCLTLDRTVLDLETIGDDARPPVAGSRTTLLGAFDANVVKARAMLVTQTDAELLAVWTLKRGPQEFFSLPRISALRSFVLNHMIHHRGQLTVYLRLRDIPVPAIYGPTADEH